MPKYEVKLNMSAEYIVEANSCPEAERMARTKFENDHLIGEVIVKEVMDITEERKLYYPELSTEGFRTIKITAGMTQEFEIISTNAPDSVIKANMQYISSCEEVGEQIKNPYAVIEAMGFMANCFGCQDDFDSEDMEEVIIDAEFDYYNL